MTTPTDHADAPREPSGEPSGTGLQHGSFTVPGVPVSVNVRWQPVGRKYFTRDGVKFQPSGIGLTKTREARDFESRIKDYALVAAIRQHWKKSDRSIGVGILFAGGGVDIDNGIKGILDALQGRFYYNDGQVDELHVARDRQEKKNPRIDIEVWERDEAAIKKGERTWSIT